MYEKYNVVRTEVCSHTICLSFNLSQDLSSDWTIYRHANQEYELHFVFRGTCFFSVEDTTYPLIGPAAILIPPGFYHQPSQQSEDLIHFSINIAVLSEEGSRLLSVFRNVTLPIISEQQTSLADRLLAECFAPLLCREEMVSCLISVLFFSILRSANAENTLNTMPVPSRGKKRNSTDIYRTDIIDRFFSLRHSEEVNEALLAEELHLSIRQLSRILQNKYGMGFREKLMATRMEHAAYLLKNSQLNVSEIADTVGYPSESCFYQHFREYFLTTPKQYRKNGENEKL